jgi:hypothetical protein
MVGFEDALRKALREIEREDCRGNVEKRTVESGCCCQTQGSEG